MHATLVLLGLLLAAPPPAGSSEQIEAELDRVRALPVAEQAAWLRSVDVRLDRATRITLPADQADQQRQNVKEAIHQKTLGWDLLRSLVKEMDRREQLAIYNLTREYHVEAYRQLWNDKDAYDKRLELLDQALEAWAKAGRPLRHQDELVVWLSDSVERLKMPQGGDSPAKFSIKPDAAAAPAAAPAKENPSTPAASQPGAAPAAASSPSKATDTPAKSDATKSATGSEKPTTEKPTTEKPSTEKPSTEKPSTEPSASQTRPSGESASGSMSPDKAPVDRPSVAAPAMPDSALEEQIGADLRSLAAPAAPQTPAAAPATARRPPVNTPKVAIPKAQDPPASVQASATATKILPPEAPLPRQLRDSRANDRMLPPPPATALPPEAPLPRQLREATPPQRSEDRQTSNSAASTLRPSAAEAADKPVVGTAARDAALASPLGEVNKTPMAAAGAPKPKGAANEISTAAARQPLASAKTSFVAKPAVVSRPQWLPAFGTIDLPGKRLPRAGLVAMAAFDDARLVRAAIPAEPPEPYLARRFVSPPLAATPADTQRLAAAQPATAAKALPSQDADAAAPTGQASVNVAELAARIAGTNLALRGLEDDLNAEGPWTPERLASVMQRLSAIMRQRADLRTFRTLIAGQDLATVGELEPAKYVIAGMGRRIAEARAQSGSAGTTASPAAGLLQALSEQLAGLAE